MRDSRGKRCNIQCSGEDTGKFTSDLQSNWSSYGSRSGNVTGVGLHPYRMASRGGGFASQTLLQSQVRVIGGAGLCYVGLAGPYPREIPEPDVGGAACGASWHGEDERSSAQLCLVAELRQGH